MSLTHGEKSSASTSKLDVSVGLLTSGIYGAFAEGNLHSVQVLYACYVLARARVPDIDIFSLHSPSCNVCQSIPSKKGCVLKSSKPFLPKRFSRSQISRRMRSFAVSETTTSHSSGGGKSNISCTNERLFNEFKGRKAHLMVHNLRVCFNQRLGVEWRLAEEHFVRANAKRPPVALATITTASVFHCLKRRSKYNKLESND